MMNLFIYPSSIETARALILHLIKTMVSEPDKTFNLAFSGGGTPALMFDLWANEYNDVTPWDRMNVFFVDERCVPSDNSESNYGMMRSLLLGIVPIPYKNIFPIQGENPPQKEVIRYSALVSDHVPLQNECPEFDVILLGAGEDGHTSSIFPGQEELLSTDKIYQVSRNPHNGQQRIAMTGAPILNARRVIFLITGKNKADVVEDICNSGDVGPASFIAHHAKTVDLFLDENAAFKIR